MSPRILTLLGVLPVLGLAVPSMSQPIAPMTVELSGFAELETMEVEYEGGQSSNDDNVMITRGSVHLYPAPFLFAGPTLTHVLSWDDVATGNRIGVGGELGIISALPSIAQVYGGFGAQYLHASTDFDDEDVGFGLEDRSDSGHMLTLFAGLKVRLAESFCLNVQPGYTWRELGDYEASGFTTSIGFSGLLGGR